MANGLLISAVAYMQVNIDTELWRSDKDIDLESWLFVRGFNSTEIATLLGGNQVITDEEYPVTYKFMEI